MKVQIAGQEVKSMAAWVEAHTAIHTNKVMTYQVWRTINGVRTRVASFSVHRKGGWQIALYLANQLRDDINQDDSAVN